MTDPGKLALTPQQAADQALAAIDPSTAVTVDGTAKVAGRDAYELVLTPRDQASLVGQVRIAVDAEQHLPLRVQVWAKDAGAPAFEVGFTQVSFDAPPAEQFQFSPPPGATVDESTLGQGGATPENSAPGLAPLEPGTAGDLPGAVEPTVVGTGWTSVVIATVPAGSAAADPTGAPVAPSETAPSETAPSETAPAATPPSDNPGGPAAGRPAGGLNLQSLVGSLPVVSGDWGSGHLLKSALFSVLITDDGRVLAGAVAPETLYSAAAQ